MRSLALAIALVLGLTTLASAGKVEKQLGGKIFLSDKRFPTSAKSASAFISKVKKQSKAKFQENKGKQEWKIYFAAFFKKPLPDIEYFVKIIDVTEGKVQKAKFEQYANGNETSILSYIVLDRKSFGVNRKLIIQILDQNERVIASTKPFKIQGEAERYTGRADFSEEEAAGGGEE
jgi:hypothetical protein